MRLSTGEAARLFNVSVRTLRYYDETGLLKPSEVSPSGYRYYGDGEIETLEQILFYRALGLPLAEIAELLKKPGCDRREILEKHRTLLRMEREKLDLLVGLVGKIIDGEDLKMTVEKSGGINREIEQAKARYAAEARERWGGTDAYAENEKKHAGLTPEAQAAIFAEAGDIFRAFAALRGSAADSAPVQALTARWQAHITKHHYTCTRKILSCLGEMYTVDARFKDSIDRFGEGTAQLMSDAIRRYCAT